MQIPPITDRQLEALACIAIKRSVQDRLDGRRTSASSAAGIRNALERHDLLQNDRRARGASSLARPNDLSRLGVATLKSELGRIADLFSVDGMADIMRTLGEREVALDSLERQDREDAQKRADASKAREAEVRAAIPVRIRQLASVANLTPLGFLHPDERDLDDVLVDFWRAIVEADAAL